MPLNNHQVCYAPAAQGDIQNLSTFLIEHADEVTAARLLAQLRNRCESLADMPLRFPLADTVDQPIRRATWKSWYIFYRVDRGVEIVRVIHQSRDVFAETFAD